MVFINLFTIFQLKQNKRALVLRLRNDTRFASYFIDRIFR